MERPSRRPAGIVCFQAVAGATLSENEHLSWLDPQAAPVPASNSSRERPFRTACRNAFCGIGLANATDVNRQRFT
jgi:hypothetical protein